MKNSKKSELNSVCKSNIISNNSKLNYKFFKCNDVANLDYTFLKDINIPSMLQKVKNKQKNEINSRVQSVVNNRFEQSELP